MSRKKLQQRLVYWAKLFFTPIAFLFIGFFAWQSRELLVDIFFRAHWIYLVVAVAVWAFSHLLSPLFYVQVFRSCGFDLGYRSALIIHVRYLPAKYIPGGIWHTVGRVAEFKSLGFEPKALAVFLFLENSLAAAVTFLLGASILCIQKGWILWDGGMLLIAVLASGALIAGLFVVNSRRLTGKKGFSVFRYLLLVGTVMLFWFFATTAFVLYINAVSVGLSIPSVIETAGIYLFSWGVGYVSLFAPQGVGVFEAVVSMLLDSETSMGALVVLVAGFRVVILAADMMIYLFVKLYDYIDLAGRQTEKPCK